MQRTETNGFAQQRSQFELIARNEYTKGDDKNPIDCSLYYLALKKKTVLQGLWRMATWHKEQVATQRLLANNFDEPKWRTTALKNAYALLSKRRFGTSIHAVEAAADLLTTARIRRVVLLVGRPSAGRRQCMPEPAQRSAVGSSSRTGV